MSNDDLPATGPADSGDQYVVVARRYRPASFEELVGQQQVCQGLTGAIHTNRVGHAYLFTGARGVGKTSTARILAKALNCEQGPSITPCNTCDICRSIAAGEDVDVLEIDGASNRGIDEIRQLRSNVNIRPSRSRYKIYIIDEVHMLTAPAFNALLKTLEEPPEHVKFVFCTTDPEKIPITVLSRCQRFDFAPVQSDEIVERLRHIVQAEGIQAEEEALQLLARRAGGSMRDSQSLLEQLLASCQQRITLDDVHTMLGTAPGGRLTALAESLMQRDAPAAIAALDAAVGEGVDVGQLTEQLLGYFRDLMAAAAGCPSEMMLHTSAADYGQLASAAEKMGLETVLAALQILDTTVTRMRQTSHLRALAEMALVQICRLGDLDMLAGLVDQLRQGKANLTVAAAPGTSTTVASTPQHASTTTSPQTPAPGAESNRGAEKKTVTSPADQVSGESQAVAAIDLTDGSAERIWKQVLAEMGDLTAEAAGNYKRLAISAPNHLVVSFQERYNAQLCQRPGSKQRLEEALARATGRKIRIDFEVLPQSETTTAAPRRPVVSKRQRMREVEKHPLVRQALDLFDGEVIDLSTPRRDSGEPR